MQPWRTAWRLSCTQQASREFGREASAHGKHITAGLLGGRHLGKRPDDERRVSRKWVFAQQAGNLIEIDLVDGVQIVSERAVLATVGPMAADDEEAAARPFAAQHRARFDFGLGLQQLGFGDACRFGLPIDVEDALRF